MFGPAHSLALASVKIEHPDRLPESRQFQPTLLILQEILPAYPRENALRLTGSDVEIL
jgi:hypothetical protein